jgi:hypothetical protein
VLGLAVLVARAVCESRTSEMKHKPALSPEQNLVGSRAWGPIDFVSVKEAC